MSDLEEYEPPLFDNVPKHRPPPTPAEDEAGRRLQPCGQVGPMVSLIEPPPDRRNPPKCNRTAGHEGPHQELSRRTFGAKAEWT